MNPRVSWPLRMRIGRASPHRKKAARECGLLNLASSRKSGERRKVVISRLTLDESRSRAVFEKRNGVERPAGVVAWVEDGEATISKLSQAHKTKTELTALYEFLGNDVNEPFYLLDGPLVCIDIML